MSRRLMVCLGMIAAMSLVVGCQATTVSPNYTSPPVNLEPSTTYELVGDATGSAEGTVILGLFTIGVESKFASLPGPSLGPLPSCAVEKNAMYNAMQDVEDADALVCPVVTIDETNYVVFKKKKVDIRAKAVKLSAEPIE